MLRGDRPAANAQGPLVLERRGPQSDINAFARQRLGRRRFVDLPDFLLHIVPNRRHIDLAWGCADSEAGRSSNLVGCLRHSDQRLAWHTSCPRAVATDAIAFREQDSRPKLRGKPRGDEAASPSADDRQIVLNVRHADAPQMRNPAVTTNGPEARERRTRGTALRTSARQCRAIVP